MSFFTSYYRIYSNFALIIFSVSYVAYSCHDPLMGIHMDTLNMKVYQYLKKHTTINACITALKANEPTRSVEEKVHYLYTRGITVKQYEKALIRSEIAQAQNDIRAHFNIPLFDWYSFKRKVYIAQLNSKSKDNSMSNDTTLSLEGTDLDSDTAKTIQRLMFNLKINKDVITFKPTDNNGSIHLQNGDILNPRYSIHYPSVNASKELYACLSLPIPFLATYLPAPQATIRALQIADIGHELIHAKHAHHSFKVFLCGLLLFTCFQHTDTVPTIDYLTKTAFSIAPLSIMYHQILTEWQADIEYALSSLEHAHMHYLTFKTRAQYTKCSWFYKESILHHPSSHERAQKAKEIVEMLTIENELKKKSNAS